MASKPILFSTPMVQALLEGIKTMTRRVIKPQPIYNEQSGCWIWSIPKSKVHKGCCTEVCTASREWWEYLLPDQFPYQPGDILWVRETWAQVSGGIIEYKASYKEPFTGSTEIDHIGNKIKWCPSIFMPREAARIFLRVTNVRAERLQEITPYDAWNEGCRIGNSFPWEEHILELQQQCRDIVFKALWDSTIKKQDLDTYGWNANPWVWVYEFERVSEDGSSKDE